MIPTLLAQSHKATKVQDIAHNSTGNARPLRVVIYGWYGVPNVGDEAILASIVNDLRRLIPQLHITVFSFDPAHTLRCHNVDNALLARPQLTREQKAQLMKELGKTDLFILGGGGMFHSHSGRRPWLNTLALAKLMGCKTMIYTIGIDPSSMATVSWRLLWRFFCLFADYITVRDHSSRKLLLNAGVRRSIIVIPDPVFRLSPSPAKVAESLLIETIGDLQKPVVSFGVGMPTYRFGPIDRFQYIEIIAQAADYIVEHFGTRVLLIPYDMQPGRDKELCLEILGMMKHRHYGYVMLKECAPGDVLALNNYMHLSICTRFHSVIFALITGTPFVSIIYQQKVSELLKDTKLENYGIKFHQLNTDILIDKIVFAWQNQSSLRRMLLQTRADLYNQASAAPELALKLLTIDNLIAKFD